MRRICVSALLLSAFSLPVWADPLQISPDAYNAGAAAKCAGSGGADGAEPCGRRARWSLPPRSPILAAASSNFCSAAPSGARPFRPPTSGRRRPRLPPLIRRRRRKRPRLPTTRTAASADVAEAGHAPVDAKYDRQIVAYDGKEPPGTIVIDTPHKFLYLVEDGGKALRYGIGVGRPGFTWAGVKTITVKREWPDWRPPEAMLKRQPELPRFMAGGPENPLGARAMYLGSTDYRIHGSNEPWTIGHNVSSGCIRLRNADVIDLYNRVKVGTKVVVM